MREVFTKGVQGLMILNNHTKIDPVKPITYKKNHLILPNGNRSNTMDKATGICIAKTSLHENEN